MLILFFILSLFAPLFSEESPHLTLRGHLDKELLEKSEKQLESLTGQQLIIQINSNSAELAPMLNLAKKIYEQKLERQLKVIVYIEDSAVGPVAMLPFLADALYISLAVSWGDIPLGTAQALSTNILRNRVVGFIAPDHPKAQLLSLLAAAMCDPSVQLGEEWKGLTKSPGEPLVLNQNQLKQLQLVSGVLSPEKFQAQFALAQKEVGEVQLPATPSEAKLREHLKFNPAAPNLIGWIKIDDRKSGINEGTWIYVKKALDFYKEKKPILVVLELNTPGGEVYAAQKISDALKELDTQHNIPVVTFINNWAISAGAMLAYSTRFIVITKDAAMGAAEPLQIDTTGETKVASEKVNSALRADFANRAGFFGRNRDLAEAMVDKDIILVYRYGKIVRLDSENQIRTAGPDPDTVITPKGKLLTLNSDQLMRYDVADTMVSPAKLEAITAEEKAKGEWPASKSLLFTAPVLKDMPQATIVHFKMDWKTKLFVLLANPVVSSALFMGLMIGLYMELSSPGFGLAGTLALTCLFLIVLSSFALEIGNWLELILLLTGLAILFVELFLLPTFGLLGFIGILFFLVGLFGMMLPGIGSISYEVDSNTVNAAGEAFLHRLAWLSGAMVIAFFVILLLARYVTPALASFSRFVLEGKEQEGYIAGENPKDLPAPGTEGEVVSTLRPAGKVLVRDAVYDAMSSGGFIEKGSSVVVDRVEGSTLVVREKE